jgi:energy-coupling factor transporter ATP-binding protein EcfA2
MDETLLGIVFDRLEANALPAQPQALTLAALEGDDALAAELNSDVPSPRPSGPATHDRADRPPLGAYLRSVTVNGFRGIGPSATLTVAPGPGLTLVVGRNGSGKSSFAEALEVLLTGTLKRIAGATQAVKDGWPSLHAPGPTQITAEFLIEGKGQSVVGRDWPENCVDITQSAARLQIVGQKREPLSALGWDAGLTAYRPFLSYAELEAFFGRPSELHDLLASVLGLDDLTAADARLNAARKKREDALTAVKKQLGPLRARLESLANHDQRAGQCLAALAGATPAKWDISAARATATGGGAAEDGRLGVLRRITQLAPPPEAEVEQAVASLQTSAGALREVAGTDSARARDLVRLLDCALGHYTEHGDGDCPVCGNPGVLTSRWQLETSQHRARLSEQAATAEAAVSQARTAVSRALTLVQPQPTILSPPEQADGQDAEGDHGIPDLAPARAAWQRWASPPQQGKEGTDDLAADNTPTADALTGLAEHLASSFPVLASAVADLIAAASKDLARRDDQWSPVAADVAAWCGAAEEAIVGSQPVAAIKQARKWLADSNDALREERLAPLAGQSRSIWSQLRQESSVSLDAFRLSGVNTSRRLDLGVSVDGEPGTALGTMSQGEINALALSVFLPRATMPESPFGFLVIDDPVQAMDPAKVDGLARVLAKVAVDRQVIVFTHDNRLAAAVRDLCIPATILEVTRQPKSNVAVRQCLDPSRQALKDAGAVNADQNVPHAVAARVVPGLCRTAAEAAFAAAYWRRQLRAGDTHDQIESAMEGKNARLVRVAALATAGDANHGSQVITDIGNRWGRRFGDNMNALNRGSHRGHQGDLDLLIGDTRTLVAEIETRLP